MGSKKLRSKNLEKIGKESGEQIRELAKRIASSSSVVVFTGAGMSTESGIPDYRSQGGLWDRFQPVYFDEFMSSRDARIRYWDQRIEMEKSLKHAKPNKGHLAIARLEEMGCLSAVITQNIDGLHHESGIPHEKIIELHGNTRRVRCMTCLKTTPFETALKMIREGDPAPNCPCGGYLKPDTVSFGQAMVQEDLQKAAALSGQAEVFIAVGSTLLVQPAAAMPEYARSSGAFTVIINLSDTPFDTRSHMVFRQKAGPVLTAVVREVEKTR